MRDRRYQEVHPAILSRTAGIYLGIYAVWVEMWNTRLVGGREKCKWAWEGRETVNYREGPGARRGVEVLWRATPQGSAVGRKKAF